MSKRNSPETAEEFLRIIYKDGFAPAFEKQGFKLPWPIDIDFGFTSSGTRKGPGGEYYEGAASTHGVPRINIRAETADLEWILKVLGHQCVHAAVGAADGHGKKFFVCAQRMQYEGSKMREVVPGRELLERVHALAESVGSFPRGALKFETHDHAGVEKPPKLSADHPEKQKNRQLKIECRKCDQEGSPNIGRMSAQTLREKGAPICRIHNESFWHEPLPPSPEERRAAGKQPVTLLLTHEPAALTYAPVDGEDGKS